MNRKTFIGRLFGGLIGLAAAPQVIEATRSPRPWKEAFPYAKDWKMKSDGLELIEVTSKDGDLHPDTVTITTSTHGPSFVDDDGWVAYPYLLQERVAILTVTAVSGKIIFEGRDWEMIDYGDRKLFFFEGKTLELENPFSPLKQRLRFVVPGTYEEVVAKTRGEIWISGRGGRS